MFEQNSQGLAIYGGIVGTAALGINLFNFLHSKQKDAVQLSVECHEDEHVFENINKLFEADSKLESGRFNQVSVYAVIVRNIGNIEAHIQEVGITDELGLLHNTLVSTNAQYNFIGSIAEANPISIEPKAMKKFNIYLKRGENIFTAVNCFVIDQQQKQWKAKLKLPQLNRHMKSSTP